MPLRDLRHALAPVRESVQPFAAAKRSSPRHFASPPIAHLEIAYRQWDGPRLPWRDDFGKAGGQVYSRDGSAPERSCNEVEVAKRLRRVRNHAYWVSCYRADQVPELWRPWVRAPDEAPDWLQSLDRRIRAEIKAPTGGIPDVVAWNDDDPLESALFVECKGPKEGFKEGQEDWVAAAIRHGISPQQLAVAIRTFV